MSQLLNLENKWGTRDVWTLQSRNRDGTLPGNFTGSDALVCNIATSQGAPAVVTAPAAWAAYATGLVTVTLSAANSALLSAGEVYQAEVICTPSAGGDPVCLVWATLTSLPSAGSGGLLLRSLVELDEAIDLLSFLSVQQQDMLGPTLEAATEALEALCRRILVLTDFDKLYRPGRTRKIYLDTKPVAIMTGLSWGLDWGGTIQNMSSANQLATVSMTPTSSWSNTVASITLNATSSGVVQAPIVLTAAAYPTIGQLLTAVNSAGNGWQGTAKNNQYALWPTARLNYQAGAFGAIANQVQLQLYQTDLYLYDVDYERGIIELTQNLPEAYRYGDRTFGISYGFGWSGSTEPRQANVRGQYRAGYAILQSDLDLGYVPVPANVKTACLYTAAAILQGVTLTGPVQSQSVTGRSYTLRSDASVVPHDARVLLSKEINRRFGGWGTR